MSQAFSPAAHNTLEIDDRQDSVGFESLEDYFEDPLSPFTTDLSSPLVSPLSLSSDIHPEAFYRRTASVRRGRFACSTTTALNARTPLELPVIALLLTAFKRTSFSCKAGLNDIVKMDIGWPTNVQHINHVTFDRFNGFLGLPVEFELEVPRRVPSASASVFGVSAESMQCSYDQKGNSVPTILLLLQERLYDQGGLQAEGIFRINAENGQEEQLRDQLNKGIVPYDIDVHCLAGLIKAWFRELPQGVLDSLTPEQVMQCNTEEQCAELIKILPPTQAALLSWAINLMADVVQEERSNKMNARNIAMVFAPNMTQMSDPLTALMHAVQVMNLLKTLILRTVKDREEATLHPRPASSCNEPSDGHEHENADPQQGTTPSSDTQTTCCIEKEGCFVAFKDSEIHEEFESVHGSEEIFSRYCSTREIMDEDEFSFDSLGPFSNASSTMDNTDDDTAGLNVFSNRRNLLSVPSSSVDSHCMKNEGDMGVLGDFPSYFNKAQYLPFRTNGKQKNKVDKPNSETNGFVQCGVLESLSFKGKGKDGGATTDKEEQGVETW